MARYKVELGEAATTAAPGVLMVTRDLQMGGAERVTVSLANWLAAKGYNVGVVGVASGPLWTDLSYSVRQHKISPRVPSVAGLAYQLAVHGRRYALWHAHQRDVALIANAVGRSIRHPCLVEHAHTVLPSRRLRRLSFKSDMVLAVAPDVSSMLINDFRLLSTRLRMVGNTVPFGEGGLLGLPLEVDAGEHLVLGIGRLVEQKDPLRWVDVVAEMHARQSSVTGRWLGSGELLGQVKSRIAMLRAESYIMMEGEVRTITDHLAGASILLSTSRWEGLPLAYLEAAAAGVPTVATTGLPDDLTLGVRLDVDALPVSIATEGIKQLAASRSTRESLRRAYIESYANDVIFGRIEEAYREVLG